MWLAEARVQQASVVASPLTTPNTFTFALRSGGRAIHETKNDGKLRGSSPDNSYNTLTQSASDVEVRIDMAILKDTNESDGELIS